MKEIPGMKNEKVLCCRLFKKLFQMYAHNVVNFDVDVGAPIVSLGGY
jgi:hypothetical protein